MTGALTSIEYAILAATDYDATLLEKISTTKAYFEISVSKPDDSRMSVLLLVEVVEESYLKVREKVPKLFPASCPQRHINPDGSFCLGWLDVMTKKIIDKKSASEWWEILYAYLRRQIRASSSRRWPGEEWAHGHPAAASQLLYEDAAKQLGEDFVIDIKKNNFRVERLVSENRHSALLKVYRKNVHIYSVWETPSRLTNSRKPCPCKSNGKRKQKNIRSCGKHRQSLIELAIYLHNKEVEEEKYVKAYASLHTCCGSLDKCPIKDISGVVISESTMKVDMYER